MLTSYIHSSILKMLLGSKAYILFSLCWDRKEVIMDYEINLNAVTYELVETYNRLLHNDVCIADAYRDEATENFEGAVGLLVLTGRIEDNEEAFEYIETLKNRFGNCRKCFEEEYEDEILIDYEKIGEECECDYSGVCAGESCPMYWKCRH